MLQDIATALPQCLVDHMTAFKATAANFPKTTVGVVHLLSLVGLTSLDRSREVLDYIVDVVPGVEAEKHGLVLKEVSHITRQYPVLLSGELINRLAALAVHATTRTAVQELRNEYNLARVDRSLEKLAQDRLTSRNTKESSSAVTIVSVNSEAAAVRRQDVVAASRDIQRGAEVAVVAPLPTSSSHYLPSSSYHHNYHTQQAAHSSSSSTTTAGPATSYVISSSHGPATSHVTR